MTGELDPSVLPLLRRLGIRVLLPGHESGNDRMLRFLKGKRSSVAHTRANCLRAKELGMQVLGSVMFGSPTETLAEMEDTLDLMRWIVAAEIPGEVWPYVAQPLPGTHFWKVALERGKVSSTMDFDRLDFERPDEPLLLDEGISQDDFAGVMGTARALSRQVRERSTTGPH
jgi:radical SAM superfamily enzyme YgiQ (UPF0313 family)